AFTSSVRKHAQRVGQPLAIELFDDFVPPEDEISIEEDPLLPEESKDEPEAEDESSAPVEKKPPPKKKEKAKAKEKALAEKKKPLVTPIDSRRTAVEQHVANKEQEPNPDAQFLAEHANHVDQQTQAKITASDQNASNPDPGSNDSSVSDDLGNSEENKIAQSEDKPGDPQLGPAATSEPLPEPKQTQKTPISPTIAAASPQPPAPPEKALPEKAKPAKTETSPAARQAQLEKLATLEQREVLDSSNGSFGLSPRQMAQRAQDAQKSHQGHNHSGHSHLPGVSAAGVTSRGINLRLSPAAAASLVRNDDVAKLRREAGQRRLSQHRGSWKNQGLKRWRAAIENYVATVTPGNQTALNTAASPFASYLNSIHQRLHQFFAQSFLGYLTRFPADHPLNNMEMSTHLEIALNRHNGNVVKMGVIKSSGVTAFDIGALDAVQKAAPYGTPPGVIVSDDGNVYLHWEFHRNPMHACSTYYARPKIIRTKPTTAPPRDDRAPVLEKPQEDRHGSHQKHQQRQDKPG
ncbi:MAG: energy transducer TonB, partial [Polyangiaceae bacterium]|nr:energy transducer TonB [Polyangiaceae bacterium]